MADDVDSWCDAPPPVQLTLFPRLSANVRAVLRLIEGPNPRAEAAAALDLQAAAALDLQARRHEEQLRLMRRLFAEHLAATREAVRNEVRAFLAEAGLGLEAQGAAAEEDEEDEEDELPRASIEDVD